MTDEKTGISLRFIRAYDPNTDRQPRPWSMTETIWQLAISDERDVSFMQKMFDAREYVKSQIH